MASKTAAGFVIFKRVSDRAQYLLLQTSYGIHHWTPPKGHVDPGEIDELVTAYRETAEESGFVKDDLNVLLETKKVLNYMVKGKPKIVIYWLAELVNSNAVVKLSDEHKDFKWLELEEACTISQYEDMQGLLRHYDNFLKNAN